MHDRGPGIAEADAGRIFDRFYRAEGARALPGSGLGLSIVRDVVERCGGRVEAATAPGRRGDASASRCPWQRHRPTTDVDVPLDPPIAAGAGPAGAAPSAGGDDEVWAPPVEVRPPTR